MKKSSPASAGEEATCSRYPGTRPFTDSPEDQARFYGREAEGEELYLRVLSVPLLVQFAASGLGKTSLLQAYLFPRLWLRPFLPVMVRLDAATESLVDAVARSLEQACKTKELKFPKVRKDGLWELLSTALVWRDDLLLTPVLVFDQFEEVFTLRDRAFRDTLADELGALATGIPPERMRAQQGNESARFRARPDVKIVISLREEYLGNLEEFSPAIPNLFRERLRLEPLDADAAGRAIVEPAKLEAKEGGEPFWAPKFDFDKPALEAMLAYLKGRSGVIEPFALQLLARHAEAIAHRKGEESADEASEARQGKAAFVRREREETDGLVRLTLADFDGGKDFEQVLKNFYQNVLATVQQKLGTAARNDAEELCEHGLLDSDGCRLLLEEGQIRDNFGVGADTLTLLGQERLIRREPRLESVFCEISHDRLAETIHASRRNKLPKREQEQKRALERLVFGLGALCAVLVIAIVAALWAYKDAVDTHQALEEAKVVAEQRAGDAQKWAGLAEQRASDLDKQLKIVEDQDQTLETQKQSLETQKQALETEKKEAEAAAARANKEKERAEGLLGFTLGERFLGEIRDLGRTSTLEKVRKQTESAKARVPSLVGALAWRNAGDVERNEGHLGAALANFRTALDVIEKTPDDPEKRSEKQLEKVRETARTLDRIGDALQDSGQMAEALKHFEGEVKAWRRVIEAPPSSAAELTDDCASLADALVSSGNVRVSMGDAKPALAELNDALDIAFGLLFGARSAPEVCRLRPDAIAPHANPRALLVASEALGARFFVSSAFYDDGNAAAGLAMEAARLMPGSLPAGRNLIVALTVRGKGQTGRDAVEAYESGTARARDWSRWDPNSKMAQRELAVAQLLAVGGTIDCYLSRSCACPANNKTCEPASSLNEAEATALYALQTLRVLAQSDPSNTLWRSDEASAWQTYAKVLSARGQGRNSERLRALEDAERIHRDLKKRRVGDREFAWLLVDKFDALADLGRLEDAKRSLEEATGVLKDLAAAHPDNEAYYKADLSEAWRRAYEKLRKVDKTGADDAKRRHNEIAKVARVGYEEEDKKQLGDALAHVEKGTKLKDSGQYGDAIKEFEAFETSYLMHMRYRAPSNDDFFQLGAIYRLMAEAQEKLGNVRERDAALCRSMHAAEITVSVSKNPDKDGTRMNLLMARLRLITADPSKWSEGFDEASFLVARESTADAHSLLMSDRQNMVVLSMRGMLRLVLGKILQGRNEVGWQEAIRSGVIDAEFAAGKNKQDKLSLTSAGDARVMLARDLKEQNKEDEARDELQRALKDYLEASRRDPKDTEVQGAIRDTRQALAALRTD
jgi:tetratricopeptide (TPR) repeat protein